ncbi:4'-phosphopantetheinyl transferase superfamily protein [Streptomyces sp. TBY4]|uniref:4'-phosphopantetheinyl transferase family protein n=1 Tax=Streptomyces sp. TBY4 TaxID=2962030 RepID=UPI0020B77AB3|nr:4'-phosphopantetheinyl transferase superfamily protein [Streptomyces sp. TBY4]MCP3760529.1 4'-phosphopantetheinyl transferase superfamily protein [Streptomyces sp. TBY4]
MTEERYGGEGRALGVSSPGIHAPGSRTPEVAASGYSASTIPAPGECHLWHVPVRERPDWLTLLDREERAGADRFAAGPAREVFVTSRAAQRLVGAHYLGLPPGGIVITRDCDHCETPTAIPHGRPCFAHGTPAPVDYSVSHTSEHLLIAVTGYGAVGVDIESGTSIRDVDGLARTAFTPGEQERFATLPASDRTRGFLTAWTRKEAAMKLTGLGLRASPRHLDVSGPLVSAGPVTGWPDAPVHLYDLPAPEGHAAALASNAPVTRVRTYELPEAAASGFIRRGFTPCLETTPR